MKLLHITGIVPDLMNYPSSNYVHRSLTLQKFQAIVFFFFFGANTGAAHPLLESNTLKKIISKDSYGKRETVERENGGPSIQVTDTDCHIQLGYLNAGGAVTIEVWWTSQKSSQCSILADWGSLDHSRLLYSTT